MKRHETGPAIKAMIVASALALVACGPKPPATEPGGGSTGGGGTDAGEDKSTMQSLVDRLNAAISEGNQQEASSILEKQTAEMIVEFMGLVPEWVPVGGEISLADYLDWEKENGIIFLLKNEKEGKGTLVGQVDGLDEFEGEVFLEGEGDEARLEFLDLAAWRRDEILSQGLQREKLVQIVENVNKAISTQDPKLLEESLTNDTINAEVKLYSYFTTKKSNLSAKGLVKWMKQNGYEFSVSKVKVGSSEAILTVKDKEGVEVLKGDMVFKTEIGKMRLDYAALLEEMIAEEQAKRDEKKSKKKGK